MDSTIRKIIIILFSCWTTYIQTQQAQELFLLGNKEYEKGNFNQALQHYQAIKKKGPAVWYNMGNCCYHEQNFVPAIVCWQRSCNGASAALYNDAQYNCAHVYQKLGKPLAYSLVDAVIDYAYKIPTLLLQLLFLLVWYLLWWIVTKWHKTVGIYVLIVLLIVSIIYFGCVVWYRHQRQRQEYGIVTETMTPLYVGPHTQYHTLGTLDGGEKILLVQKRPDWYKVAKDGACGWVPSCAIEIINHHS